jgi:phosphoglycolate phosphatase-like HAD superfamily hydrolase
MKKKKKENLILFDFDGVIADTKYEILKNAKIASNKLGYQCNPTLNILSNLKRMEFDELGIQIGIEKRDVLRFVEIVLELFSQSNVIPEIFNGIGEILKEINSNNYICIITGNSFNIVKKFLEKYELVDCVHAIYDKSHPGSKADKVIK